METVCINGYSQLGQSFPVLYNFSLVAVFAAINIKTVIDCQLLLPRKVIKTGCSRPTNVRLCIICSVAQKRLGVTIRNDCDPQLLHEQTAVVETTEK